jgi:hypothetical protein
MTRHVDLRTSAIAEAGRLEAKRTRVHSTALPAGEILILIVRPRSSGALHVFRGLIFFFRVRTVDGIGRLLEDVLVPVRMSGAIPAERLGRRWDRRMALAVATHGKRLAEAALAAVADRARAIQRDHRHWLSAAEARDRRIAAMLDRTYRPLQPGLFDRRSSQSHSVSTPSAIAADIQARLSASSDPSASVFTRAPVLVLILLIDDQTAD